MAFKRVLLVRPQGKAGLGFALPLIPLGLEYIASSMENVVDHINIVDMGLERHPFQYFLDLFQPDLAGITMSATEHKAGLKLAEIAKKNDATTVLGGYHPTAISEELLLHSSVDMVVRREGELTMRELVQKGSPAGVLGVSYKEEETVVHNRDRPLTEDLDSLPFPARHLRRHKYVDTLTRGREADEIHTSRGCSGVCSFCCEPSVSGSRWRGRSPENVMEELLQIYVGKPMSILIGDANFMHDAERVDRLCDLLSENNLDIIFQVMVRADVVAKNPQIVKKMCENGIIGYEIGIESPNLKDLKATRKGITTESQWKAIQILRENGANAGGTFVIGLPTQTEEEIRQFPVYAKKIGLTSAAFGIATPFPNTEFYRNLEKKGLIVERDWTKYDEVHSVFKLPKISMRQMEELATYCMGRFWTPDALIEKARILQGRSGRKTPLKEFLLDAFAGMTFLSRAGLDAQEKDIEHHGKIFLEAMADPYVEEYTRKVGAHNVIEMSRYLNILGSQLTQLTLTHQNRPLISFLMKTTSSTVEYIKVVSGKQDDATIDFDIELGWINSMPRKSGNTNPSKYHSYLWLIKALCRKFVCWISQRLSKRDLRAISNMARLAIVTGLVSIEIGRTTIE